MWLVDWMCVFPCLKSVTMRGWFTVFLFLLVGGLVSGWSLARCLPSREWIHTTDSVIFDRVRLLTQEEYKNLSRHLDRVSPRLQDWVYIIITDTICTGNLSRYLDTIGELLIYNDRRIRIVLIVYLPQGRTDSPEVYYVMSRLADRQISPRLRDSVTRYVIQRYFAQGRYYKGLSIAVDELCAPITTIEGYADWEDVPLLGKIAIVGTLVIVSLLIGMGAFGLGMKIGGRIKSWRQEELVVGSAGPVLEPKGRGFLGSGVIREVIVPVIVLCVFGGAIVFFASDIMHDLRSSVEQELQYALWGVGVVLGMVVLGFLWGWLRGGEEVVGE